MESLKKVVNEFLSDLEIEIDKKSIMDSIVKNVIDKIDYSFDLINQNNNDYYTFNIDTDKTKNILSGEMSKELSNYKEEIKSKIGRLHIVHQLCKLNRDLGFYNNEENQSSRLIKEVLPYYKSIITEIELLEARVWNLK